MTSPFRSLLGLLALAFFASTAQANVIVYKGTARTALPSTISQLSALPHVYVVVDLTANKSYFIYYYTLNKVKGSLNGFPLANTRYVAQAVSATKTVGTFTYVEDNSAGADVGVNMFYLRGTQRTLQLSTNGGGTFGNFPKTLGGFFRTVQRIGQSASLFEFNYTLTFDATHTQLANNVFNDGFTTAGNIANELSQKGY